MKLDEYVEAVKRDLDAFKRIYSDGIKIEPDKYPTEMSESEWDEQLMAFFATQGRSEE